jgi:hypothetical protein
MLFAELIQNFDRMEPAIGSFGNSTGHGTSKLGPKYRYGEFALRPHPLASGRLRKQYIVLACNTILTFIQTLPPVIPPQLRGALLECIKPSLRRDRELQEYTDWVLEEERDQETLRIQEERRHAKKAVSQRTFRFRLPGSGHNKKKTENEPIIKSKQHGLSIPPKRPSWTAQDLDELEEPQIEMARVLIMHFPPANLSLLAYLFDFFLHIPYFPQNGMTLAGIAEKFGSHLCPGFGADRVLLWLLERWPLITKGVVGLEEDEDLVNRAKQLRELHTIDSFNDGEAYSTVPTPARLSRANSAISLALSASSSSPHLNKGKQLSDALRQSLGSRINVDEQQVSSGNDNDDDDDNDDDNDSASMYSQASAEYLTFPTPRQLQSTDRNHKSKG